MSSKKQSHDGHLPSSRVIKRSRAWALVGERRKLSGSIRSRGYDAMCLYYVAKSLTSLHNDQYVELRTRMKSLGHNANPGVTALRKSLDQDFNEVQGSIEGCIKQLEAKHDTIKNEMRRAEVELAKVTNWWENDNIFLDFDEYACFQYLPKAKLDAMINYNPPKDPVSYGNALKKMVVKILKETKRRGILHVAGHFESFIDRFLTESVRISRMSNGSLIAFCLIFDLVTNIIPLGGESLDTIETVKVYQSIDRMLSDILRVSHTVGNPPFFALGEACRKMREKISLHCGYDYLLRDWYDHDDINNNCPHNFLIKSLHGLQCYAYFEIRSLVRLATGNRLPAELVQLVFENALDAEGICRDPRLLAPARDPCDRRVVRCMLPCEHDLRFSPRDEMGLPFAYVSGDDYELLRPTFSHDFESYEEYVQAERDAVRACDRARRKRRTTASSTDPSTRSNPGQVATWPIRPDVGSDLEADTDSDSNSNTEEADYIF